MKLLLNLYVRQAKLFLPLFLLLLISACSVEPQAIDYGHDACEFCRMTIMDSRYGSEIVTKTGKAFKFDAIECLVNYRRTSGLSPDKEALILVTDYSKPGELQDATKSLYLHSPQMPSPMGMFLTAFSEPAIAKRFLNEKGGKLYEWEELLAKFEHLNSQPQVSR